MAKESPPASLDNFQGFVRCLILRTGMKLVRIAACSPRYVDDPSGVIYEKHFLWTTTISNFESLGSLCELWPLAHTQFGGKRNRQGGYISSGTARYSKKLSGEIAGLICPHISSLLPEEEAFTSLEKGLEIGKDQSAVLRVNMPAAYIKDDGGKMSSGDWSTVPAGELHR